MKPYIKRQGYLKYEANPVNYGLTKGAKNEARSGNRSRKKALRQLIKKQITLNQQEEHK